MSARRSLRAALLAALAGALLIGVARMVPADAGEPGGAGARPGGTITDRSPRPGFLAFARSARRPGNLVERVGTAGRSAQGRPIRLRQLGDPRFPGELLVFTCIHGDECAAAGAHGVFSGRGGCPDPSADIYLVGNLDPDGSANGTRLNSRGVDLNRNFPAGWRPDGSPGDPEYPGRAPLSEPESRLAVRIVRAVRPAATVWFHQHYGRPFVRAWGGSVGDAARFARLAGLPFEALRWPAGTAPNWQNHRFPESSSFVVELSRGPLPARLRARLGRALLRLGRDVRED